MRDINEPIRSESVALSLSSLDATVGLMVRLCRYPSALTLAGRGEAHGPGSARVHIGGHDLELTGYGQWHEQLQDEPRFRVPFTYASLVGEEVSLVALRAPGWASGFVRRGDVVAEIVGVDVGPQGATRHLSLTTSDGETVQLAARRVHTHTVSIYQRPWHGSRVTAVLDGQPLAGAVNDWSPDGT